MIGSILNYSNKAPFAMQKGLYVCRYLIVDMGVFYR